MKNVDPILVIILLMLFFNSCSVEEYYETETAATETIEMVIPETKVIETEIAELINEHRMSLGLNNLLMNDVVKYKAKDHNLYMIARSEISHDNFAARASFIREHTNATRVSENVAYGFNSSESVIQGWINSPSHYETMKGDFTHFDISAEKHPNGQWYFTNIFIKK